MAGKRTTWLRQLAEDHNAANFEINFSHVAVWFHPDTTAEQFTHAVSNHDHTVAIDVFHNEELTRIKLSLGTRPVHRARRIRSW